MNKLSKASFEEEYVMINGIEHFFLHYPKKSGTPVLLYIHGGPGMFESLLAYRLDEAWGDMFTHVHYDQRGSGKTLSRNKKNGLPKSIDQMSNDLHSVVLYVKKRYQTDKIVLLGNSWGSVLGSLYALNHPENLLAYIGSGQVISMMENEKRAFNDLVFEVNKKGNPAHIKELNLLGDYPPSDPKKLMKLLPKMRKLQDVYEDKSSSSLGLNDLIKQALKSPCFRVSDFWSFLRIMNVNRPLHLDMMAFDLNCLSKAYSIPVHFILGELDNITPTPLVNDYYKSLNAPSKSIQIIPNTSHNPMHVNLESYALSLATIRDTL